MEEIGARVGLLSLKKDHSIILENASRLIGKEDALNWYNKHEAMFKHPRFTDRIVLSNDEELVSRIMRRLGFDGATIWAHTHPDWQSSFGIYIVRRGTKIVYEGASEHCVEQWLGLKALM